MELDYKGVKTSLNYYFIDKHLRIFTVKEKTFSEF